MRSTEVNADDGVSVAPEALLQQVTTTTQNTRANHADLDDVNAQQYKP